MWINILDLEKSCVFYMKIDKNRQGYKSRQNIKMMYLKGLKQVILTF